MLTLLLLACTAADGGKPTDDSAPVDTDPGTDTDPTTDTDTDALTETDVFADAETGVHPGVHTIVNVRWSQRQAAETWLSWDFEGETQTSPVRETGVGTQFEVVLGLPADTTVPLRLHARVGEEEVDRDLGDVTTGPLPGVLTVPTLTLRDADRMRPEPYLLTSVNVGATNFYGPCFVVILDAAGRIVWYAGVTDSRLSLFPKVSRRGGYLTWDATSYYAFGTTPGITRSTLDLTEREEVIVEGMGLAYDELPDGAFLFDENEDGYRYHLSRQDPDGTRTRLWDCYTWMSPWYSGYWGCAPNTVTWDEARGTVLWSMFETSTVVELDPTTGEILREFGDYPGGYTFAPESARFELQHYPNWSADGTLMVSTHVPDAPGVQMAREFLVDDAASTLVEQWSYTPASGWYADYAGQVQKLPTGNVLWQLGTAGVVQEVTPAGEVVWEVSFDGHLLGNTTPIADLYAVNTGW